jgi:hypothetical protein
MKCRFVQLLALVLSATTTMSAQGLALLSAPLADRVHVLPQSVQPAIQVQPPATLTSHQIESMYRDGLAGKDSRIPGMAAHARRLLQWHDVLTAKTAADRHAAIKRLPVTVSRSVSDDGVTVDFVSDGKSRVRLFEPTNLARVRPAFEHGSGPSAVDSEEQDECYDGEPPCATQEDMEDAAAVIASVEADVAAMEAEFNQQSAGYCSIYSCDGDEIVTGGPSAAGAGCWTRHFEAGLALAGTWAYLVFAHGTISAPPAGMTLSAAGTGALVIGAFAAGYTAGTAVNASIECYLLAAGLDQFAAPSCPARLPN